ncbi:hypothetical protein COLO4_28290 [Corchorus olitorius]|uniref:Myb/SANT-like domain-containing protein n=1 Tax=Corchorus olitorius TaxID=93759 RepID=A0A1R3HM57_9ROSI|nr:hypothetical protein COLO4_28290 [Corchorus olitorius]
MDRFGRNGVGNVAVRRPVRWSRDEERAFIECFETSMHRNMYRAFRDFELIERLFNVKCPMRNPGIAAIQNHLRSLMRIYKKVHYLLEQGFTFDVETNQVVGTDEQWNAVEPLGRCVRNREFPHFPKLDEIMIYKRQEEAARNDREQEAVAMEGEIFIEFA